MGKIKIFVQDFVPIKAGIYEEYFPKISLANTSLRKKKLEYSQPRNILAQNIPGDSRIYFFFAEHFGSLYNGTEISTR